MYKKRKIGIIIGTRPQFVKIFPLVREIKRKNDKLDFFVLHTGQHFDPEMSGDFISGLNLPQANYNLNIHSSSDGETLGKTIDGIAEIIKKESPEMMVVFGDSHSTLAGALASKYCNIPLLHIEAGCRSYDMSMPEEINRMVTDSISDLLFCSTQNNANNLSSSQAKIVVTGDIMLDAFISPPTPPVKMDMGEYILFTIHRRKLMQSEDLFKNVINAIEYIDKNIVKVVAPLHPHCRKKLDQYGLSPGFIIIPPQPYLEMKSLIINSQVVVTDSGGLQKEAFFAQKNCITLRENTEWVETIQAGHNVLAGYKSEKIIDSCKRMLAHSCPIKETISIFGDGKSASRIVDQILTYLSGG